MANNKCFGNIFPNMNSVRNNEETKGEVFSLTVHHQPISKPKPEIVIDNERWDKCFKCESYKSCYDLSMAKVAFQSCVKSSLSAQ